MKTTWFTITPENAITAFATEQEARDSECRYAFCDVGSLETILQENEGLARELWNQLPGIVAGSAPSTIENAAGKIWKRIQSLASAVHAPAKGAAHRAQAPLAAKKAPKSSKKATPKKGAPKGQKTAKKSKSAAKPKKERAAKPAAASKDGFREGTKASQVVEMLRKEPATLAQIMKRFGWLAHTTRALLSAGGSLAKNGITVISEKVEGGERTYRIAS